MFRTEVRLAPKKIGAIYTRIEKNQSFFEKKFIIGVTL